MTSFSALRRSITASVMPFKKTESFPMTRKIKDPFWLTGSPKFYEKSAPSRKISGAKITRLPRIESKCPHEAQ